MVVVSNDPYGTVQPTLHCGKSKNSDSEEKNGPSANEDTRALQVDALLLKPPMTVLELLTKGAKERNLTVVKQCIYNLEQRLDQYNVLFIFASLSKYVTSTNNNYEPSAPPMDDRSDWLQDLIQILRQHCLLEIDKHADFVLGQAEILQLNYNDLVSIIERDTLQISSESLVYATIYKWGEDECHRRGLDEHNINNLKNVLQQLQYGPRYGLLTKTKFTNKIIEGVPGPTRSGILDEKDWRLIKFYLEDKAKNRPVKDLPHKWSTPRIAPSNTKEVSSICSSPKVVGQNKTACERCIINFLTCWTAVFD